MEEHEVAENIAAADGCGTIEEFSPDAALHDVEKAHVDDRGVKLFLFDLAPRSHHDDLGLLNGLWDGMDAKLFLSFHDEIERVVPAGAILLAGIAGDTIFEDPGFLPPEDFGMFPRASSRSISMYWHFMMQSNVLQPSQSFGSKISSCMGISFQRISN